MVVVRCRTWQAQLACDAYRSSRRGAENSGNASGT